MELQEIITDLEARRDPAGLEGMARFGIATEGAYGVRIPELRRIARRIGHRHDLACDLWAIPARETRILAGMVDEPHLVTERQMEQWVEQFADWELCDQSCMNLFEKTPFAWQKTEQWAQREAEFVRRAGFVLMARLAVSDKPAEDQCFEAFFPLILQYAKDNRNYVKKAVSWALRQIGKRNPRLCAKSLDIAVAIRDQQTPAARWIAAEVTRELSSSTVQERLAGR